MTWADVMLFDVIDNFVNPNSPVFTKRRPFQMREERISALDGRENLKRMMESVRKHPRVAEHLRKRPADERETF